MEPSQEPLDSSVGKFSPLSFLSTDQTPSKISIFGSQNRVAFNLNALPITLIEALNQNPAPNTSITSPQTNQEPNMTNENSEGTAMNNQETKCQFCNVNFNSEELTEHIDNCDMRKINCDKCGERVLMDVFDIHYEECESDEMDDLSDGGSMEEENTANNLTYERLLELDENVVKKGMTEEQLKEFQEFLYVKSLDGEGSCVICMCDYQTGEYLRKLSCCHLFHKGCIDQWLGANITCPTCKKYLR